MIRSAFTPRSLRVSMAACAALIALVAPPRPREEMDPRFVKLKHEIRDLIHDEFEIDA